MSPSVVPVDFLYNDANATSTGCSGSGKDISNTSTPFLLPGLTDHYPEGRAYVPHIRNSYFVV